MDPYLIYKYKLKIKDLNIRLTIIKHLKEKAETLHNIRFGYDFLDMITNAQATKEKIDKLDCIKLKNCCTAKGISNRVKGIEIEE